jgi:hypothetical protein
MVMVLSALVVEVRSGVLCHFFLFTFCDHLPTSANEYRRGLVSAPSRGQETRHSWNPDIA